MWINKWIVNNFIFLIFVFFKNVKYFLNIGKFLLMKYKNSSVRIILNEVYGWYDF